jgi:tetratricopeptide (TPR) repeat protein
MSEVPEQDAAPGGDARRLRAKALMDSGRVLSNSGRFEEALSLIEQAIAADPSYDRAPLAKAFVLAKMGRLDDALAITDEFLSGHPDNAYAHTTRGTCLIEASRFPEAEEEFRAGVRLGGDDYIHAYNYACFLAQQGREEETREMLGRALELGPHMNTRAATDVDFERYRDAEWFQDLVAFKR